MADVTGVPSGASAVCEPPALQAAETHPSQTPRVRISGWGILLGCFLVYQGAALLSFADREVAHDIPRSYDQAVYLAESYRIFTSMQAHGVLDGLFSSLQYSPPAGVLMEPLAALAYTVVGPTRMTALGLNVFAALAYM
ncbi:MAG: hypothetical protein JOY61_08835, partial [Chloroflexi bacterium]|nr:hypothetical protein [Chloroflexota bacterium]